MGIMEANNEDADLFYSSFKNACVRNMGRDEKGQAFGESSFGKGEGGDLVSCLCLYT
jgi:hypothetical protein